MNIVLLSGGSGERLWPLSNEVRSKQFVQLFKRDDGAYESMLQRVYRQIKEVDDGAKVTIATSKAQVSSIRHQLSDAVAVCVEPCRRDTFPAVVLATAYMHDVLGLDQEQCIAVCPVDPYVDVSYYEAVNRLEALVQKGGANLSLMGIAPTYPSEKYGYIIPEMDADVSRVKAFKEKPDAQTAKEYIRQGALWNAGVFAFKIGYLLGRAHEMIDFRDYHDLYAKYDTLNKISFDYAVVEKEPSIQVLRYEGDWKDVGTWNMMAEVMTDTVKGNGLQDETCVNTHVVNELDIPVLCMGLKNVVVAASNDGILVTDKERSGYMKPYVQKVKLGVHFAEKSWGTYTVLDVQPESTTVKITVNAGASLKYHSHEHRDEIWTVLDGEGYVVLDDQRMEVRQGSTVSMPKNCKHTLAADTPMTVLEIQLGQEISQHDKKVYSRNAETNSPEIE